MPRPWGEACTNVTTWSSLKVKQYGQLHGSAWARALTLLFPGIDVGHLDDHTHLTPNAPFSF